MGNKLKVGDRVRIRGLKTKGMIVHVSQSNCCVEWDAPANYRVEYHHECLIKLKKQQRLECWVNCYDFGLGSTAFGSETDAQSGRSGNYIRTVKMREVRDE